MSSASSRTRCRMDVFASSKKVIITMPHQGAAKDVVVDITGGKAAALCQRF